MVNIVSCRNAANGSTLYLNAGRIVSFYQMSGEECKKIGIETPAVYVSLDQQKFAFIAGTAQDFYRDIKAGNASGG